MRRLVCVVVAAVGVAVLALPADAAGVLPVVTILPGAGTQAQVGFGGDVPAMAYVDNAGTTQVHVAVNRGSWVDTVVSDPTATAAGPDVAVSATGQVDVAWGPATGVTARRQRADGTWEDRTPVTPANPNSAFSISVASNPRGDAAIAWVQFSSGVNVAYASVRRVGEAAWSSPQVLSSTSAGDFAVKTRVGLDDAGGVTVVWQRETALDTNWILEGRRLSAGSATWGAVAPLPGSAHVSSPSLSVDRDGNAVVAWLDNNVNTSEASYWPAGAAPSSAKLLAGFSEPVAAFARPGQAVVAALDPSASPDELNLWSWSEASGDFVSQPVASAPSLTNLGLTSDQNGNLLAVVKYTEYEYVRPLDPAPVLRPLGGDIVGTSGGGEVAMDRSGDAVVGWSGWRTGSAAQEMLATVYDATGPSTTLGAVPTWTLGPSVPLAWSGLDRWSTVATSTLRRASSPGGAWSDVLATGGSSASQPIARGATACFAVRATDPSANTGAWSATQCTTAPVDDRSMSGKKNWGKLKGTGFYAGTALKAKAKGRALKLSATGKQLALVASRCGACGSVKVVVNGVVVRKVSLKGAAANRVVFPLTSYSSARVLKVKIVTTSAKKVVIDGLGVSQS